MLATHPATSPTARGHVARDDAAVQPPPEDTGRDAPALFFAEPEQTAFRDAPDSPQPATMRAAPDTIHSPPQTSPEPVRETVNESPFVPEPANPSAVVPEQDHSDSPLPLSESFPPTLEPAFDGHAVPPFDKTKAWDLEVFSRQDYSEPLPPVSATPELDSEFPQQPYIGAWDDKHVPIATDASIVAYNRAEAEYQLREAIEAEHRLKEAKYAQPVSTHETALPAQLVRNSDSQRMSAFARLKFDDGLYYMHTYSLELGRDSAQFRRELKRKRHEKRPTNRKRKRDQAVDDDRNGLVRTQHKRKREDTLSHGPRSVISETGGIVRVPAHDVSAEYQHRRASEASQSISSSSHHHSQDHSLCIPNEEGDTYAPSSVMIDALPEVPRDLQDHVPDPRACPFLPIHSRNGRNKGTSRKHGRIEYYFPLGYWRFHVLGSNGVFHNDEFYTPDEPPIPLQHDDVIQIGQVKFSFQLPESDQTEDEASSQSIGGRSSRGLSFAFENGQGQYEDEDVSSEGEEERESIDPRAILYRVKGYRPDDSDEDEVEEEDEDDSDEDAESVDDEPLRKRMQKKPKMQTLKLKMSQKGQKASHIPVAKQSKKKSKPRRLPSPTPPPPPPPKTVIKKVQKGKQKEAAKEVAKDKSKPPTNEVDKPKEKNGEVVKPADNEPQAKPEAATQSNDSLSAGTIITREICERYSLHESMIGQEYKPRKGPGRPPKDGFMSKREKAALARKAKDDEKLRKLGIDPKEGSAIKEGPNPKLGRAQKEGNGAENEDVKNSVEGHAKTGASDQSNEKKPAKSSKPPRSPSPVMKETDYTEEELARPPANYVVMIHEAISASKTGSLNLQQIYSAIERKHPYYKFRVATNGWQSSVRHNLGQHDAFKKGEKEGKGYNWVINPSVSIEKDRRKRATPPPQARPQNPYYSNPQQYPTMNSQGVPQPYYPGYSPYPQPHGVHADAAARVGTPGSKDVQPSGPRLPPSLARSNAPANVATTQGASTYASPWGAGTENASRPSHTSATQGSDPYPPTTQAGHGYSPYGPPRPPLPPSTQGGTYGMLFPNTSNSQAHAAPSPYQQPYPATSQSQAYSGAQHPYPPHVTAGPPQAAALPRTQPPEPRLQSRYPRHISRSDADTLDAFRSTFIDKSAEDKAFAERKVDNAIRQIVSPASVTSALTEPELNLVKIITPLLSNSASQAPPQASQPLGAVASQNEQKEAGPKPPSGRTLSELATNAATMAASDAVSAVAADAKPAVPESTSVSGSTLAAPQLSTPPGSNRSDDSKANPKTPPPANKAPALSTLPDAGGHDSSNAKTRRPTVEPLTPVPGSPMVVNQRPSSSAGAKRAFCEVSEDENASAGDVLAKEGSPSASKRAKQAD
ncbi:uncharacterized protein BDZ99DRAFT_541108 [Mytilinidion resinicola]|uniref:Fork-head domain-containing protein n=1 Tax=Mytilinidion resinicola TaxID=574789 RepID=A0A6A6Y9E1_9PEZI|nr:uncharacterized protein BDZ99DRAFT_541108 [Mytilinidion resinicola]KAF2805310.1 hypothetical protein BDZ99DRAFT_541108 [Mytilinidion resinicola]